MVDQQGDGTRFRSDPVLVQSCLDGDETAWEALVDRYGRLVYSIPRRMGFSDADADDVFQVVLTTLFRRLSGLRDQTRLSSWLITTTRRECWRLAKAPGATSDVDETIADDGIDPGDEVAQAERDQSVREALGRLDDRCRQLLTALFLEPDAPSYDAIAARFGMPVGSIGPTRARCFKKLETILAAIGIDADA